MREPGRRRARDLAAMVAALFAHGLALVVVARLGGAHRPEVKPPAAAPGADETLVDLVDLGAEVRAEARDGEVAPRVALAATVRAHLATRPQPAGPAELGLDAAAASEAVSSSAPSLAAPEPATTSGEAERPAQPIDLGLGANAWTRWLGTDSASGPRASNEPRVRSPVVRVAPASTTGGLVEGMAALDQKRAARSSGRVVNALEQAAHGEGAFAFGAARFAVTVLRTGAVEVKLEHSSTTEEEWKRIGARAAADLVRNAPRIPPPHQGAHFVVELVAEMALPNGARVSELYGPRIEATPPRVTSTANGRKDMLERNPTMASGVTPTEDRRANVELPGVYLAERGKVCGYRLGLTILGPILQGGCDPVNAGAKPQRVVHASVRDEELF